LEKPQEKIVKTTEGKDVIAIQNISLSSEISDEERLAMIKKILPE